MSIPPAALERAKTKNTLVKIAARASRLVQASVSHPYDLTTLVRLPTSTGDYRVEFVHGKPTYTATFRAHASEQTRAVSLREIENALNLIAPPQPEPKPFPSLSFAIEAKDGRCEIRLPARAGATKLQCDGAVKHALSLLPGWTCTDRRAEVPNNRGRDDDTLVITFQLVESAEAPEEN